MSESNTYKQFGCIYACIYFCFNTIVIGTGKPVDAGIDAATNTCKQFGCINTAFNKLWLIHWMQIFPFLCKPDMTDMTFLLPCYQSSLNDMFDSKVTQKTFWIGRTLRSGGVPSGRVCYQRGYPI